MQAGVDQPCWHAGISFLCCVVFLLFFFGSCLNDGATCYEIDTCERVCERASVFVIPGICYFIACWL